MLSFTQVNFWFPGVLCTYACSGFLCVCVSHFIFICIKIDNGSSTWAKSDTVSWLLLAFVPSPNPHYPTWNMSHISQTKTLHQTFSCIWITVRQKNNWSERPVSHIEWWWQLFPIELWVTQRPVQFDLLTSYCL